MTATAARDSQKTGNDNSPTSVSDLEQVVSVRIKKRDGTLVPFDRDKITQAVYRCFINSCDQPANEDTLGKAKHVTDMVCNVMLTMTEPIDIEEIQSAVETQLMAAGYHLAAKEYILYRAEHERLRDEIPIDPEAARIFVEGDAYFDSPIQAFQHYSKYARYRDDLGRRETFPETADRIINHLRWHVDEKLQVSDEHRITANEWQTLHRAILEGESTGSMRLMQMAGPAAQKEPIACYNCAFVGLRRLRDFSDALYILMQGTGLGCSVEKEFVHDLPKVRRIRKGVEAETFVIPDSTVGWCDALKAGLETWFDGRDVKYDDSQVRPKGARLKTKGGTASGPGPLRELLDHCRSIIRKAAGRRLEPIEVYSIICKVGEIVQVGGVRRAALITIFDADDHAMLHAKDGNIYADPARIHYSMSNNSVVVAEQPDDVWFLEFFAELGRTFTGEPGIFNRYGLKHQMPERRRKLYGRNQPLFGTNPCGEILLHPGGQFCNLSLAIVRPTDDADELERKVRLAAQFGTLQASMTDFGYIADDWRENCQREALLGVDLLGAVDNPLLQGGDRAHNIRRDELLERLRLAVIDENEKWAKRLGINPSTSTTCIKPGGNSSLRWGTGQSMSGWYSEYMVRRVEVGRRDPIWQVLTEAGVPSEVSPRDEDTSLFMFPMKAPDGAQIVNDLVTDDEGRIVAVKPRLSAVQQLDDWLAFKVHWTEHNPSVSIYYGQDELIEVTHWMKVNFDNVCGIALFPRSDGIYPGAPMTPISGTEYERLMSVFPKSIDWSRLLRYETYDQTTNAREYACAGGLCEVA